MKAPQRIVWSSAFRGLLLGKLPDECGHRFDLFLGHLFFPGRHRAFAFGDRVEEILIRAPSLPGGVSEIGHDQQAVTSFAVGAMTPGAVLVVEGFHVEHLYRWFLYNLSAGENIGRLAAQT